MIRLPRVFQTSLLLALLALPPVADAASYHPFLFGGIQSISWEKKDLNEWLDSVTYRDHSNSWEAGAGVNISPREDAGEARAPLAWTLRIALGRGNLPGNTVLHGRRFDFNTGSSYFYSFHESYDYRWWSFTTGVAVRPVPWGEAFLAPGLQDVHFMAQRDWDGPSGLPETGDATDQTDVRYGLIQIGGRLRLPASVSSPRMNWMQIPLSHLYLEGNWAPFRARLSTTHEVTSDRWTTANFSTFEHSYSIHLGYEF